MNPRTCLNPMCTRPPRPRGRYCSPECRRAGWVLLEHDRLTFHRTELQERRLNDFLRTQRHGPRGHRLPRGYTLKGRHRDSVKAHTHPPRLDALTTSTTSKE
jgi:hypothetical protein